jgi:hypothetical protein
MNPELVRFEQACNDLLTKRKMMPSRKIGLNAFCTYFITNAWYAHSHEGDGFDMLSILEDDTQLIGGEKFNINFVLKFEQLYPNALKNNKTWQRLIKPLIKFKGKGVGVGELYLALVISGWSIERTNGKGDGKVAGGIRELKNNGASLKPLATAIRIQDNLNESVFQGHRAGPITKWKENHKDWIDVYASQIALKTFIKGQEATLNNNIEQIYLSYFTQLYPGRDVTNMCKQLAKAKTGREFNDIIGREVLRWYKIVDNWDSLVVIDQKNMTIANVADTSDEGLKTFYNIKFDWKSERGQDTQAISDGYVNIII